MYKQMLKAALAATVVLGTAGAAKADLTLNGNTGMFLNPNAYLVEQDRPQVQVNYFKLADDGGYTVNTYNLTGVMRAGDRVEVGAGISKLDADYYYYGNDTDFILNGKYQLRAPESGNFALAAGVGYNGALADNKYAYLVASKPFGNIIDRGAISASLGVRWDSFGMYGDNSSKVSIFGGVEVPVGDKLSVVGELQSKNLEYEGATSPYSIGLRYRANDRFTVGGGFARTGIMDEGSNFFVQVGYNFGN